MDRHLSFSAWVVAAEVRFPVVVVVDEGDAEAGVSVSTYFKSLLDVWTF